MRRGLRNVFVVLALAGSLALAAAAATGGEWLSKVPTREHDKKNPFSGKPDAVAAGRRLFVDHCAACHGENALGSGKRPPLRSPRIQDAATEGDLHWFLRNGNLSRGMPSWSRLPDPQLWQLVTYLKSLRP